MTFDFSHETYQDVERLIHNTIHSFLRLHPNCGTYEELLSEANLAFTMAYRSWDADRADFTTWCQTKVWRRLLQYRRETAKQHARSEQVQQHLQHEYKGAEQATEPFDLQLLLADVGEDARAILSLVFETPHTMEKQVRAGDCRPATWRKALRQWLATFCWPRDVVENAFREIREALATR